MLQDDAETLHMAIQRIKDLEWELHRAKHGHEHEEDDGPGEGDDKDDQVDDEAPIKYPDGTAAPCLLNCPKRNNLNTI